MDSSLADPQQMYWPVYIAFFEDKFGNISQAIFVEDDSARQSGRLMNAETFRDDLVVGTKCTALTCRSLSEIPTYIGKLLKGQIKPTDLYHANAICKTVMDLDRPAPSRRSSTPWTEPALAELESEGVVQPLGNIRSRNDSRCLKRGGPGSVFLTRHLTDIFKQAVEGETGEGNEFTK